MPTVTISQADVASDESRLLLRDYFAEILRRLHGREVTPAAVDRIVADERVDDLVLPDGSFLVARNGNGLLVGCVGLRRIGDGIGEIKRMYVAPSVRGQGLGAQLLDAVETDAIGRGWHEMRLDTRSELAEARSLYESRGYAEVDAYNDNPHAQHWYVKALIAG